MSKLCLELLNKNQKKVLEVLKNFSEYGTLGGGTALMVQLSHRYSYDFDIFLPKLVSKKFTYKVKQHFKKIEIIVDAGDEFSFLSLPYNTKVSFIHYPFSPLYEKISTSYLNLFSWREIGLDKAHTVGRRGEWRDYVDLYFIMKNGFSLESIIQDSEKKFGDSFSEKLFLSQLTYYGDIEDFSVDFIEEEPSMKEIKNFLARKVEDYKKEKL